MTDVATTPPITPSTASRQNPIGLRFYNGELKSRTMRSAPARYNAVPAPPDAFAAITAITQPTGPSASAARHDLGTR